MAGSGVGKEALEQLDRYGRVARNSQMLLVMWPSTRGKMPGAEEAREAISQDAIAYLNEVQTGVESPYFTPHTDLDRRYVDSLAVEKVRWNGLDLSGVFATGRLPKIQQTDPKEVQAAAFSIIAASCMRQVNVPFFQVAGLRVSVKAPGNLAEFMETVKITREVTFQARGEGFDKLVERNDWRVAFAFWGANKWLSQTLKTGSRA